MLTAFSSHKSFAICINVSSLLSTFEATKCFRPYTLLDTVFEVAGLQVIETLLSISNPFPFKGRIAMILFRSLAQAKDLANCLLALPEEHRPSVIFSSPFHRCLQTSQITSIALGIPIYVDHRLSEWYSDVTAAKRIPQPEPPEAAVLRKDFPEIDAESWSRLWYPPTEGENVIQITARMSAFLSDFIPEVEKMNETPNRVLLVSHAAPIIGLVRILLGEDNTSVRPGCCSLTEFERTSDSEDPQGPGGKWSAKRIGDASYVSGDIREWGFEDYY